MKKNLDDYFMARAIELAEKGLGKVSPNPMVGCVIVKEDEVIAEGWHKEYGEAHAEVNAINTLKKKTVLKGATAYVSLEPCSHFGKTPPCADLLIKHRIGRVVIANQDSFPLVDGGGIKKLREAGIEVEIGVLSDEARRVNKRFFTRVEKKRPYVILKWAETVEGFIARENYDSKWISNDSSRKLVHKWRAEEDAIMVGTNTAKYDNPKLNVREWKGQDPIRIVIDKNLVLDHSLNLFSQDIPTIVYNLNKNKRKINIEWVKVAEDDLLSEIFFDLRQRGVQSVIVEGGTILLQSLIDANSWDEARVFVSKISFENGISAPKIKGKLKREETIEGDVLRFIKNI